MKPTIEQIDTAINTMSDDGDWVNENWDVIKLALRVLEKLMKEPNAKELKAGYDNCGAISRKEDMKRSRNAMRDQLLKEVGE